MQSSKIVQRSLSAHDDAVTHVEIDFATRLALSCAVDGIILVHDIATSVELARTPLSEPRSQRPCACLLGDGSNIVVAERGRLFNWAWSHRINNYGYSVGSPSLSPDGRWAIGGRAEEVHIFDLKKQRLHRLLHHTRINAPDSGTTHRRAREVRATSIAADGGWAASVTDDLRVWNVDQSRTIAAFTDDRPFTTCVILPHSDRIVVGDAEGNLRFFQLRNGPKDL
jgi:WD40 repeat protein